MNCSSLASENSCLAAASIVVGFRTAVRPPSLHCSSDTCQQPSCTTQFPSGYTCPYVVYIATCLCNSAATSWCLYFLARSSGDCRNCTVDESQGAKRAKLEGNCDLPCFSTSSLSCRQPRGGLRRTLGGHSHSRRGWPSRCSCFSSRRMTRLSRSDARIALASPLARQRTGPRPAQLAPPRSRPETATQQHPVPPEQGTIPTGAPVGPPTQGPPTSLSSHIASPHSTPPSCTAAAILL